MLAMPFAFVTNALEGYSHKGAYLGLFNGTICVPQIVAALCGGELLHLVGSRQGNMMIVAGRNRNKNSFHGNKPITNI